MTKEEIKSMLYSLHHITFRNEQQIKNSQQCGCFHCGSLFGPEEVTNWCDCDGRGDRTGLCPNCGIDSVIGDDCGIVITPSFLKIMNLQFFGGGIDNVEIHVTGPNDDDA